MSSRTKPATKPSPRQAQVLQPIRFAQKCLKAVSVSLQGLKRLSTDAHRIQMGSRAAEVRVRIGKLSETTVRQAERILCRKGLDTSQHSDFEGAYLTVSLSWSLAVRLLSKAVKDL